MTKKAYIILMFIVLAFSQYGCSNDNGKNVTSGMSSDIEKFDFELKTIDGDKFSLSEQKGKVIVLDFFATWCGPCKLEMPHLVKLYDKYKNDGLLVVSSSSEPAELLSKFREKMDITYPVLQDNKNIAGKYGVRGIPTLFIFNKNGKLANKHVGYAPGSEKELEEELKMLLSE